MDDDALEAVTLKDLAKLSPREQRSEIIRWAVAIMKYDTVRIGRGLPDPDDRTAYRRLVCRLLEGLIE